MNKLASHIDKQALLDSLNTLAVLHDLLPGGTVKGDEYHHLCPFHQDKTTGNASTNITAGRGKCLSCGAGWDLIRLYLHITGTKDFQEGLRGIAERYTGAALIPIPPRTSAPAKDNNLVCVMPIPANAPVPPAAQHHYGRPTMQWTYRDQAGAMLGHVYRFDRPEKRKEIIPLTLWKDASGKLTWKWRHFPEPRPLYGLDRLGNGLPILIVEGERAADAAHVLVGDHYTVMTWPAGSNGIEDKNGRCKIDLSPCKGATCVIWPDADAPGLKAADALARHLRQAGAKAVTILTPPEGKADGWDLADAQAEGWTARQVIEHIANGERIEQTQGAIARKVYAVDIHNFLTFEFPPRVNLLGAWLPSQGLVMVYAYRGIGKTHFALGVAYACVSGGQYLGWQAPGPVGVLYIDGEMPGPVMQERLSAIVTSNLKEPAAPFILLTPDLQSEGMPRIDTDEGQAAIESVLTDEIRLILVDNISTLSSARENESDGWTPVQAWALRQRAAGRSVLFVHHSGKGGAQRGTSRREDVLDTVIALRRPVDYQPDQGAVFEVHFEKARGLYGDDVKPIEARLTVDSKGGMSWATRTVEDSTFDRVVELLNEGLSQKDIVTELNIHKSNVSRHARKAKEAGLVTANIKTPRQGWHEAVGAEL